MNIILSKISNFIIRNFFVRFVVFLMLFFISFCCVFIISNMFPKAVNALEGLQVVFLSLLYVCLLPLFYSIIMMQHYEHAKSLVQEILIIDSSEKAEGLFFISLMFVNVFCPLFLSNNATLKSSNFIISDLKGFLINISIIVILSIIYTIKTGWLKLLAKEGYFNLNNLKFKRFVPLNLINKIDAEVKTVYGEGQDTNIHIQNSLIVKVFLKNNSKIKIVEDGLSFKQCKDQALKINNLLENQQLETMS